MVSRCRSGVQRGSPDNKKTLPGRAGRADAAYRWREDQNR